MISFNNTDIKFTLKVKTLCKDWLEKIAKQEKFSIEELNYIFCSDDYLHKMNVEYLQHDTLTDIITFDNSEDKKSKKIEGDIFISIDRVKENAQKFDVAFETELHRVMAHGLLHLTGYKDKKPADKATMKAKEDESLKLFARLK